MSIHIEALRLIAAKSQNAGGEAAVLFNIRKSPIFQTRYNHVAARALGDRDADFTPEERQVIVDGMSADDDSPDTGNRDLSMKFRLTASEKAHITAMAAEAGQTVTDYIRNRIGL